MRSHDVDRSLRIVVPAAWDNEKKGAFLEGLAKRLLQRQSYEVVERVRFTGMEIDLLATHKPSADRVYVECKFYDRPLSANVLDLMIGQGVRKRITKFALFSTTSLVREAGGAFDELKADERFSFSWYGPDQLLEALVDTGLAPQLPEILPASVSHATLFVHPEQEYLWLLQDQSNGRPYQLLVVAREGPAQPSAEDIRALLDQFGILDGLPVVHFRPNVSSAALIPSPAARPPVEVVSGVGTADDLIDYRPCNPGLFVGRYETQKSIIDFLGKVREGAASTRILALVGASGFGKSSLVAKISQRLRNKSWKSKFYMYPIDVRSARGSLFVGESLLTAIRNAAADGFIELPGELRVEDADNITSGESISAAFSALERQDKVLVLFFDQFEEALTKDELVPLFRAFRRFALDVHAKRPPLVVGFSWRTGISFSDDNPAYQMWNELRDHRLTIDLGPFDSSESSSVIGQFEEALSEKMIAPLRRRILEQGQGLPWLLKKLCIHVYKQLKEKKVSQFDLVGAKLNVRSLFDEDLEHLTPAQESCLKHIAANSPADSLDVYDRYPSDVVDRLSERRLIVRAGQKFAVYWDIFRDYLNEGAIPFIPLTYIPNTTLSMALLACDEIKKAGAIGNGQIASKIGYSESTVMNIITDLQNLAVCNKDQDGKNRLVANSIPDQVRIQLLDHVVYQRLVANSVEGEISKERATEVVADLYEGSPVKQETKNNYLTRLIPWLEYAGLIEASPRGLRVMLGSRRGSGFGVVPTRGRARRAPLFLGSASPEAVVTLLGKLQAVGQIKKSEVAGKLRNPAADLVALGLGYWSSDCLHLDAATNLPAVDVLREAVDSSRTMRIFRSLITSDPSMSRVELGMALGQAVQRVWKESSALRYVNGLLGYSGYFKSPQPSEQGDLIDTIGSLTDLAPNQMNLQG